MPGERAGRGETDRTRIGLMQQVRRKWTGGGWIFWSALAVGLAFFGLMLFGVMTLLRSDNAVVTVETNDADGDAAGKEVSVKTGETELTIIKHGPRQVALKIPTGKQEQIAPAAAPALLTLPFDKAEAKRAQDEWSHYLKTPVELTNSIGMKLVLVPPGEYYMGPFEGHRVRITRPIYWGAYEVTRAQFARFVAETGFTTVAELKKGGITLDNAEKPAKWDPQKSYTWRAPGFPQEDNHPVVQLVWDDATAFCDWLSRKEGKQYRLPTEAEWEYACRAGTRTRLYNGNDLEEGTKIGNIADATAKAIYPRWDRGVKTSDGYVYTSPVGKFRPNNFGLYDMIGNVSEWCFDWYDKDYFEHSPTENPAGPPTGTQHIGRGGGFSDVAGSRYRYYGNAIFRRPDWGFRVTCNVPGPRDQPSP